MKTNWIRVISDIIYTHEESSIKISIKDLEEIRDTMIREQNKTLQLRAQNQLHKNKIDYLQTQILVKAIDTKTVSDYKLDARV